MNSFMSYPVGLAFDPAGDLYIADSVNSRVQEVFTTGGQQWSQTMAAAIFTRWPGAWRGTAAIRR